MFHSAIRSKPSKASRWARLISSNAYACLNIRPNSTTLARARYLATRLLQLLRQHRSGLAVLTLRQRRRLITPLLTTGKPMTYSPAQACYLITNRHFALPDLLLGRLSVRQSGLLTAHQSASGSVTLEYAEIGVGHLNMWRQCG